MAKYGQIFEVTPAMGDYRPRCRTVRPTWKKNGYIEGKRPADFSDEWVLIEWLDGPDGAPNGGAHVHRSQLRPLSNDR